MLIRSRSALLVTLVSLAGCTKYDPLYCDEGMACTDPARPYCDLAGEYPASDGVARTCIPSPFDAGMDGGGDGGGRAADGGPGAADAGSRGDAAPPCSWSRLSKLANVNASGSDYPGSFGRDGLTFYLSRLESSANPGIFVATRDVVGQGFEKPTRLDELSSEDDDEADPEISFSGLEILYRVVSGSDIRVATRSSPTGTFGPSEPTGLAGITPSLSGDGLAVYFLDGGTVQRATRAAIGAPWGAPETVLPTGSYFSVDVSPDELRLLITSLVNPPAMPLSIAERSSTDDAFGPPVPLDEEILVPGGEFYTYAKWSSTQTEMVVTLQGDIYYSTCQ